MTVKASSNGISISDGASGFYVGLFADIKISEKFNIQPELAYTAAFKNDESTNVITMPILAKYYVAEKFSLLAGPMLDLIVDETGDEFNFNFWLGEREGSTQQVCCQHSGKFMADGHSATLSIKVVRLPGGKQGKARTPIKMSSLTLLS